MGSLSVEEILAAGGPPQKQKKKKGKTGEKAFLSRVRGKWTGFRSRAAFGRSDRHWNSGNWDWTGRQLRLSPFRIRVFSPRGVLLPATRLWVLRRTVILFASRASSVLPSPPSSLLPSLLGRPGAPGGLGRTIRTVLVAAMRVSNPDCLPVRINRAIKSQLDLKSRLRVRGRVLRDKNARFQYL
jgi:hypothetical protein